MLFKLLADYRPKAVAVAWDSRPVHRAELAEAADVVYKEGRRPMPDLLREQFPSFRPIVEAFGYRNLEFEGWEADDVIATLATRADEAGLRTCVVSTDRDAFQLCSENVCLMMTPRGVADVQVYTPERVEARYGVRPDQVPDFIGLKGDTSDNIPGVPGIGDKTAGELIGRYGSLEAVLEHVGRAVAGARRVRSPSTPSRRALSKELATMRRDLDLDVDPGELVLAPPDRSQLKEFFRRFEFRGLLSPARHARRGAAGGGDARSPACRCRGARASSCSQAGVGFARRRRPSPPSRRDDGVVVGPRPARLDGELVVHDAKTLGVDAADDTLIAAYLIDPARAEYELADLGAEYGIELVPEPAADEETAALVVAAELPRRLAPPMLGAARGARPDARSTARSSCRSTRVLAEMEQTGVRIDTYRMGEITARLAERVAELEALAYELAGEEFMLGSTQQVGAHPLRAARADRRAQGQDRLLDRREGAPLDPRRARDRRRDRGVARALEAAQHLPRAAAGADRRVDRPPAHDDQPDRRRDRPALDDEPEPAVDPDPHRARARDPLRVRRRGGREARSRPTTRRSSCGSSRTSPASRSCARPSPAARTSTARPPPRCSARTRRR